jgi:glycerophosphoryl diester phosphodiesterase
MPSLRAVLAAFPGAHFNLELKQNDPSLVHEVLSIVRRAGATDRMLLAAGDDAGMEIIRKAQPDTAIGSSIGDVLAFFQALHEERVGSFRPAGHALQIPPSFAGQALISPESLQAARSLGLFVHVWTINDPGEMRRLLALGVDGVMSDDPARLLGVARELEAAR